MLGESALSLDQIEPAEFEAGTFEESQLSSNDNPNGRFVLHSAILSSDGILECEAELSPNVKGAVLRVRNISEAHPVVAVKLSPSAANRLVLKLSENQIEQIRAAAICQIKGQNSAGEEVYSNSVALVQLFHLLRERLFHTGGRDSLTTIAETGENLVPYVDSLGSAREAIEFFNSCNIRFYDGESATHRTRLDLWRPRDPFRPDISPSWADVPIGNSAEELREAIIAFVERHQKEKLNKHARRGNLNGLPNFLDIFRTLNALLFAYHGRLIVDREPVIPFGFVTTNVMKNLELLIGPLDREAEEIDCDGFVESVRVNLEGDDELLRERLREERVPQMVQAAVKTMIEVRAKNRKLAKLDDWALTRIRWISQWIASQGLGQPTPEEIQEAEKEYFPRQSAA